MKFESDYIEKLAKIIADNGLTEISLEDGEQAITIRKDLPEVNMLASAPAAMPAAVPAAAPASSPAAEAKPAEAKGKAITSPMVGTFYAASSPENPPFVKVGDKVSKGQVLGIVEAMKLMNEIESEFDGTVKEILVENEQMVEFGQPMFVIE